jgi:hypothetical protein
MVRGGFRRGPRSLRPWDMARVLAWLQLAGSSLCFPDPTGGEFEMVADFLVVVAFDAEDRVAAFFNDLA